MLNEAALNPSRGLSVPNSPAPFSFVPMRSNDLHQYWPFLRRGLETICRKVKPAPDWIPEDIYAALRTEIAVALIGSRGPRQLGFVIYHKLERPHSHLLDMFVWAWWAIPLGERLPSDNIPECMSLGWEYLREVKKALGANRIIGISSRPGIIKKYGFKFLFYTYTYEV
jgi:hypothetical protein